MDGGFTLVPPVQLFLLQFVLPLSCQLVSFAPVSFSFPVWAQGGQSPGYPLSSTHSPSTDLMQSQVTYLRNCNKTPILNFRNEKETGQNQKKKKNWQTLLGLLLGTMKRTGQ